MVKKSSEKESIQEDQYQFPYHYIPDTRNNGFYPIKYWNWGFRYIGGIDLVKEELPNRSLSLLDIGCGDGRFLQEIQKSKKKMKLKGIDYSEKAINLATALNPRIKFERKNILKEKIDEKFDIITLIEVLEHINPKEQKAFISKIEQTLDDDGMFILTVPHTNAPLISKHYQHFNKKSLNTLLKKRFGKIKYIHFDSDSFILSFIHFSLGGKKNPIYLVKSEYLWNMFYQYYRKNNLYSNEKKCTRICAICKRH